MDADRLVRRSTSDLSVGRVGHESYAECLGVLKTASHDDPFTNWLSTDERVRDRYLRYVLTSGFRTGWVSLARPRMGVCIATPAITVADLCVRWTWLRFRHVVSAERWATLKRIETSVSTQAERDSTFVWYLGIVQRVRGVILARRLLAEALPDEDATPVLLQTAKQAVSSVLLEVGAEQVSCIDLAKDRLSLELYRLEDEELDALCRSWGSGVDGEAYNVGQN